MSSYGTSSEEPKEQLSGYFDVNNEGVSLKNGKLDSACGIWSKKKKIIIAVIAFIVLVIVIIIIATTAGRSQQPKSRGEISSLNSGAGCAGDSDKQNECPHSETCIDTIFACDGYKDCPNGEDEIIPLCDALKKEPPCQKGEFKCLHTRKCVELKQRCDGNYNCGDEDYSDERNCFKINPKTSEVSVIQHGVEFPMSAEVEIEVAELICEELGFRSLQFIPNTLLSDELIKQCGLVDVFFDPKGEIIKAEDELINHIDIAHKCTDGVLRLTCRHDFCGIFKPFSGPVVPESWITSSLPDPIETSTMPFPWVVDIFKGETMMCKGTIVNEEWVLTSLNCIDENIFNVHSASSSKSWKVVAAGVTDFTQERSVSKVMKNHFEEMLARNYDDSDNIVAIQVYPAFKLNGYAHQICLAQPAFLPHFNCFTSGTPNITNADVTEHVRVIPLANTSCIHQRGRTDTVCFEYPHASDPNSCLKAAGSPISCLDPATNSWTLSGIVTTDVGCGTDEGLATYMGDQYNFNWAEVITSEPQPIGDCGDKAQFQDMRIMRGSRVGELYVDVKGWGDNQQWHTVFNLDSAFNILVERLTQLQYYPTVRKLNNSGITSSRVAVLNCPKQIRSLCGCRATYHKYDPVIEKEAMSLHFLRDVNEDTRVDLNNDNKLENWDDDKNLDTLYEDYNDYNLPEKISLNQFLPGNCTDNDEARKCVTGNLCVPDEYVCDGTVDCLDDGSDEDRSVCAKYFGYKCPPGWFHCFSTYDCVPYDLRCNGNNDCLDSSDERECVTVSDLNNAVFIEKNGLSLPLLGLPEDVDEITKQDIGVSLCEAMGFGAYTNNLTNIEVQKYSLGCYKFRSEDVGDSYLVHKDVEKLDSSGCNSSLSLVCEPLKCGTSRGNQGPDLPASWDKPATTDTTNKDYPWVVRIKKGDKVKCSGTIVLEPWVATTADCIDETITSEWKVMLENKKTESNTLHNIVLKAGFSDTRMFENTNNLTERNIVMLGVDPPFNLNKISHPLCLRAPLYVPGSTCIISAHDKLDSLRSVRIVLRPRKSCEDAGLKLSSLPADHQCVEYIELNQTSEECFQTKGSALQCLDALKRHWTFTGIMVDDIGLGCGSVHSFGVITAMGKLIPRMIDTVDDVEISNITCDGGVSQLAYRRTEEFDVWYITTIDGKALSWDNSATLLTLGNALVDYYQAKEVAELEDSTNIQALQTIAISDCKGDKIVTCTCTPGAESQAKFVKQFTLVRPDEDVEDERDGEYQDHHGVIFEPKNGEGEASEFKLISRPVTTTTTTTMPPEQ